MSYLAALEAAGAHVEAFVEFGSYQGEWVAKIGHDRYIIGSYGSCSGCDTFEAEFGWDGDEKDDYQQRLADFGKTYLDGEPYTKEQALKVLLSDWVDEANNKIRKWFEAN